MFTMVPYRRYLTTRPTEALDSVFQDPMFRSLFNNSEGMSNSFRVDIREMDNAFQIEAELPGLTEDQINLMVDDGMLTISADIQSENKQEEGGRFYCERRTGHLERSFNLDNIDTANIEASYKNGILSVTLPKEKPEEKVVKKISIKKEDKEQNRENEEQPEVNKNEQQGKKKK